MTVSIRPEPGDHRTLGRPRSQVAHRAAERARRRIYLLSLGVVTPLVPVFGLLRAEEPFALPVTVALSLTLLGTFVGLITGRLSTAQAELTMITAVPTIVLVRLLHVAVFDPIPPAELRRLTVETVGPTLTAIVLVAHLAFTPARAVRWAVGLWAAFTLLLVPASVAGADSGATVAFSRQSVALAAVVGLAYALASIKSQLVEERARSHALDTLASTDALTGARNRRGVEETLREELARVGRYGGELSIALLDLDRFKDRNDHHGHAAGDAALVAVVEALRADLRSTDALGRWGGDELLVVVPATGADEAIVSAERWRQLIADLGLAAGPGVITTSVGVATRRPGDDLDALLIRADRALYTAKGHGGDRVVADAGLPAPARVPAPDRLTPTA